MIRAISTPFNCAIFMPSTSQVRSLHPFSLRHPSHIQWPPCLSRYFQKLDGSIGFVKRLGPEQNIVTLSLVACLTEAGKPDGLVSPSQSLTYVTQGHGKSTGELRSDFENFFLEQLSFDNYFGNFQAISSYLFENY